MDIKYFLSSGYIGTDIRATEKASLLRDLARGQV